MQEDRFHPCTHFLGIQRITEFPSPDGCQQFEVTPAVLEFSVLVSDVVCCKMVTWDQFVSLFFHRLNCGFIAWDLTKKSLVLEGGAGGEDGKRLNERVGKRRRERGGGKWGEWGRERYRVKERAWRRRKEGRRRRGVEKGGGEEEGRRWEEKGRRKRGEGERVRERKEGGEEKGDANESRASEVHVWSVLTIDNVIIHMLHTIHIATHDKFSPGVFSVGSAHPWGTFQSHWTLQVVSSLWSTASRPPRLGKTAATSVSPPAAVDAPVLGQTTLSTFGR